MNNFKNKDIFISVALFLLGVFSRAPFVSHFLNFGDGAEFAIAMSKYSPKDGLIAPYTFLYVMFAKTINIFFKNANSSFIFMSVISSGLFTVVIFWLGMTIFDRLKGLWAALIVLSAPWLWYYGLVFLPFMTVGFLSACSALGFYAAIFNKDNRALYLGSAAFALLCGWRSQDFLFTAPLFIWTLLNVRPRIAFRAFMLFLAICLLWFIPLVYMSGGIIDFFQRLTQFSKTSKLTMNVFNIPYSEVKKNFTIKVKILLLIYGLGILPLFYQFCSFFRITNIIKERKVSFFVIWIIPSVLFYLVVMGDSPGYFMQSLSGLTVYLAWAIFESCKEISSLLEDKKFLRLPLNDPKSIGWVFVVSLILINSFVFIYDLNPKGKPGLDFHYQSLPDTIKKDVMLKNKYNYIKVNFDPEDTAILSSNWYFMQNMYYLERFDVYSYSVIILGNGVKTVKYGHNHTRRYYDKEDNSYEFNTKIKNAVIFDEEALSWIENKGAVDILDVGGGYHIYLIRKPKGGKIYFDYYKISEMPK